MGRFRQIFWLCRKILRRFSLTKYYSILPEHNVVRICKASCVQNNEIQPTAFEPRHAEDYLSVHWIEYIKQKTSLAEGVGLVRDFLLEHSQFEKEFKPTAKGKLAVLRVGELVDFTKDGKTTGFVCKHMPREKNGPKFGEQYDFRTAGFDPHSGIFTLPLEGAELLAVQQYLISKIIYSEPGK